MFTAAWLALAFYFGATAIFQPAWGSPQQVFLLWAAVFLAMGLAGLIRKYQRRE